MWVSLLLVSRTSSIRIWRRGRLDRLVGVHGETGRTACQLGRFLIRLPRCLCSVSQMEASILMVCASGDQISAFDVSRICSPLQTTALVVPASSCDSGSRMEFGTTPRMCARACWASVVCSCGESRCWGTTATYTSPSFARVGRPTHRTQRLVHARVSLVLRGVCVG